MKINTCSSILLLQILFTIQSHVCSLTIRKICCLNTMIYQQVYPSYSLIIGSYIIIVVLQITTISFFFIFSHYPVVWKPLKACEKGRMKGTETNYYTTAHLCYLEHCLPLQLPLFFYLEYCSSFLGIFLSWTTNTDQYHLCQGNSIWNDSPKFL